MRLLIDANLSPRVAAALNRAGHDAVHVVDIDLSSAPDTEILEHARTNDRVIVSSDTDLATLLARQRAAKPSFVLLRHMNDTTVDNQARLLVTVLTAAASELDAGAVVTVDRGRIRTRRLPFHT